MALERTRNMTGLDIVVVTAAQMEAACEAAIRFLQASGHPVVLLRGRDVCEMVDECRTWMEAQGWAVATICPQLLQRNGKAIGQVEVADAMWDAGMAAIEKETADTTFECLIAWKDTPGFMDRSISLIPCKFDADGDQVDDDQDSFFYFDGTKTEAQIRAEYSKENSPQDWYIAEDGAVIAHYAASLGLTNEGGAK